MDELNTVRSLTGRPIVLNLPTLAYSTLSILASAAPGNQTAQFTVTYQGPRPDTQKIEQPMSAWTLADQPRYINERLLIRRKSIARSDGTTAPNDTAIYQYSLQLDPSKNLKSLTLPTNPRVSIFAITLRP